jgi:hypothetical protein
MTSLIAVYYEQVHPAFPIVSNESVVGAYLLSTLSPVLANAMAALAAMYI